MQLHTTTVLASLLLATTSLGLPLVAQHEPAAPGKATLDAAALAPLAKIKLDQAIGIAQKARPGIATTAELEATTHDGAVVPCFEVMLLGSDQAVYEVRVHAISGKVLATEACEDKEDVAEVKAAAMREHTVTLASMATEARKLLRGTCIGAELVLAKQRAEVTLWNGGREVQARFGLGDGGLLDVKCAAVAKKGASNDDDEDGDDDEAEEHGEGREQTGKKSTGKPTKADDDDDDDDDEQHEADEAGEHERTGKPAKQPKRRD